MGRAYAGILGPLAFGLAIARGLATASGVEGTLLAATAALFVFAAIGFVAGQTADYLVSESVRTQFELAMANWEAKEQQAKTQTKQAS
jgi:hypothetical protein